MRRGVPLIITGAPLCRQLVGRWTFDYLAKAYTGPAALNVHFAPRKTRRYARFYGSGAGSGGILTMTFRQFVATVAKNEAEKKPPWRYYMQACLMSAKAQHKCCDGMGEHGGEIDAAGDRVFHASMGKDLSDDLSHRIDYGWLRRMCELGGCDGLSEVNLWAGRSGGCTPLHFDTTCNFLCQVSGRKRSVTRRVERCPMEVGQAAVEIAPDGF